MQSTTDQKSTEIQTIEEPDIFHLLESEDEQQIILETNERMKEALVYQVNWYNPKTYNYEKRDELSYAGINYLVILMAQNLKQGIEIVREPKIELLTVDGVERWHAMIICRNKVTGLETVGNSEQTVKLKQKKKGADGKDVFENGQPVYEYNKYDDFGRTKALSKAQRNAWKLQMPAKLILKVIQIAKDKKQTKTLETKKTTVLRKICNCRENGREPQTKADRTCNRCGGKVD